MQPFQYFLLLSLLTLATDSLSAQPVNEFIPLNAGNHWTLLSNFEEIPIRMVVDSVIPLPQKRRAKLTFNNPWSSYTLIVSSTESTLFLDGIETSTYSFMLDKPVELFTTTQPIGSTWSTPLGPVTYVSTGHSLSTPSGVFNGVEYFRLGDQDWFIKPGFGFVQFGQSFTGFKLTASLSSPYVIPESPVLEPSACPLLGYDISPTELQLNEEIRIQTATQQGLKFTHLSLRWTDIEKSPQVYDLSEIHKWARYTSLYRFDLAFTLRVVDTSITWLPTDLAGKSLTDPEVQQRLQELLHRILPLFNARMKWINISNEVDLFVYMYPGRETEVIDFLGHTRMMVRGINPALSVGAVLSFGTALNSDPLLKKIDPILDHVSATYYPLLSTFAPRQPSDATGDIRLLAALTKKPIILTEIGYPSSGLLTSSPQQQGEFYRNVLDALQKEGSHFIAANLFQHADMPPPTVIHLASFYYSEEVANRYRALLSSLGMKTFAGTLKPAWSELMRSMKIFDRPDGCLRPVQ